MTNQARVESASSPETGLNAEEVLEVQHRIELALNMFQHKMVNIGGILSAIIGFFIILALYKKVDLTFIMGWYVALVVVNRINVWIARKNRHIQPQQALLWRKARREYHVILTCLCLTWGAIGVLFTSENAFYELYIISYLQLLLVGFSFGTVTDFTACIISNICLLLPYISMRLYLGMRALLISGYDFNLHLLFSMNLILLSAFLLIASYVGYQFVKNFFKLTFENATLSEKLETMNKSLEKRVQERTFELETSLKLVTYQATHDLLTDLPNQRLLLEYLDAGILAANHNNHSFAVVFYALNEIEKINDGLGHQVGDFVIRTVAQRFGKFLIKSHAKKMNYRVALSRKDIFVILLDPLENKNLEKEIAKLFAILDEPILTEKQALKLTVSMGVSLYPQDGKDIKSLLMNADAAMLHAKQQGGNNFSVYTAKINSNISEQLEIEKNLHDALRNNEFLLQYQPIVDLKTGEICSLEALVRWNSPVLGHISPDNFINLAEANGIIIPLGDWIIRAACLQLTAWHHMGFANLRMCINVSAKQLQKKSILQTLGDVLRETELNPESVTLELTETVAFQSNVSPIIKQFKAMGFRLSIDDFGTGYSGLSNLKLFEIDTLKIDKSFIMDICTNENSRAIVSNTIALAKKMGIKVVAEGIETPEELHFLQQNQCDMVQGYYFSQPINPDTLTQLLGRTNPFNLSVG